MTRGYPLILLGVAFLASLAALLLLGPDVASDEAIRSKIEAVASTPFYFLLTTVPGLLLIPTLVYPAQSRRVV